MDHVVAVNEEDEIVGTIPKDVAHRDGTLHRIAVTYVESPEGKFLVQIRMSGALDHSSAGHVHPGETYEQAARRELEEELGIGNITLERIGHGMTLNEQSTDGGIRSHLFDVFVCTAIPGSLQVDEVKGVFWADSQEVLEDMRTGASGATYAGGFRTSLPIYSEARAKK